MFPFGSLKKHGINAYIKLYPSGELKLVFNTHSVLLPGYIYSSRDKILTHLVSSHDKVESCLILRQALGSEIRSWN